MYLAAIQTKASFKQIFLEDCRDKCSSNFKTLGDAVFMNLSVVLCNVQYGLCLNLNIFCNELEYFYCAFIIHYLYMLKDRVEYVFLGFVGLVLCTS